MPSGRALRSDIFQMDDDSTNTLPEKKKEREKKRKRPHTGLALEPARLVLPFVQAENFPHRHLHAARQTHIKREAERGIITCPPLYISRDRYVRVHLCGRCLERKKGNCICMDRVEMCPSSSGRRGWTAEDQRRGKEIIKMKRAAYERHAREIESTPVEESDKRS